MTLRISRPAAMTSLALAMASCYAHAEPAPAPAAAPADTVVVTATRTPQPLANVISDTVTIAAEQISESGAVSIVDLLQRQRGIEIARNGGAGTSSSVYLRGSNSNQTLVLVDGARIGSSTTGAANWSAIPLTAIDHIEIVYGPLSSLYGADAIGGVIQIFTKKGKGAPSVTAFVGYGSDKTREADATVSGATGGEHSFSYAISAGKEKSDGFSATRPGSASYNADRDAYDKDNASGQFSLQLAPGYEAGALFLYSKLDSQYDGGASAFDVRSSNKLQTAAVYGKARFVQGVDTLLQYSQSKDNSENWSSSSPAFGYSRIDSKQTDITLQNDVRIGDDVLQVLYDHRKEEVDTNGFKLEDPTRTTNSWAASYNARRGASLLNAAVRRDKSVYGSKTTGSVGYGYDITSQLRATASYGTSFRAPTYNELYYPGYGNAANKPEVGKNAEIGVRWDDGVNALSASYYHNKLTDLLVNTTPCPYPGYSFGCAYNVSKALLEGVTIAGATKLAGVNLTASIDLQDPQDETTNKRLARRSKKHGNVTADYSIRSFKLGAELTFSGDRFDDAANKNRLGGYGLVNLYATYAISSDWSALVRWNNVADKQYDLARNYATPGSNVFAGIRYGYK